MTASVFVFSFDSGFSRNVHDKNPPLTIKVVRNKKIENFDLLYFILLFVISCLLFCYICYIFLRLDGNETFQS